MNNNAAKQQVNNASNSPKRVVVTRSEYDVVYDHAVALVVAYSYGHKVEDPRKGFAFGPAANGSHTRNYAKSLIWGFATNKALKGLNAKGGSKDLKVLDELTDKAKREKIAIAILSDCSLVKGDSKAIEASLNKVEPKRERVFAESVLTGLQAEEKKAATTPKGGKGGKSKTKNNTPKGVGESLRADYEATVEATGKLLQAMGAVEPKATAPKGSKAKGQTKAAPKGAKANGKAKAGK